MEDGMSPDPIDLDSGEEEVNDSMKIGNPDAKKGPHKPIVVGKNFKRQRRLTSSVWVHFDFLDEPDKNGNLRCKCKKCGQNFNADSKMGTGNLRRHLKNCKMRTFRDVGQMILEKTSSGLENRLPVFVFDIDVFRELLAAAIVKHDLPFQFVEYEGIRKCFSYLHPDYKSISRHTIKSDVMKMYKREKERLKEELSSVSGKVALTSDCWTSITTDGYITLTAHFIGNNWCLQKRILNFSFMPPPHTGVHLCDQVCTMLKDWGVQKKTLSITLDNASSNDVFVENLKGELDSTSGVDFFHVRCCAHILNLVVNDGLKEIHSAVAKVRESVKYCKGSQARKQRFLSCVAHVELSSSKGLKQDVPTRWNSTYLMLESALYFKKAFVHFQKVDANYVHCPTMEEWARVEKIFKFLKVFYDVTVAFSGSKYPTANLYFPNVLKVRLLLKDEMASSDEFMRNMATRMFEKFGKYWSEFSTIMAVSVILDPRFKLQFIKWGFNKVYGHGVEYESELLKVTQKLQRLYDGYALASISSTENSAASVSYRNGQGSFDGTSDEFMTDFDDFSIEQHCDIIKTDLESYLEEPLLPRSNNIDILSYWRTHEIRYPVVAKMARDVLAIPISTVASESAFSTGGRVLDCYRSSLKPTTAEAIICLRDWSFGEANMEPQMEDLAEQVMNLKVEDDEDTPSPSPSPSPSPYPSPQLSSYMG